MTTPLLEVRQLVKRFGAVVATAALDLTIMPGEIHAVIGPNGAGKTTLIGQLAGEIRPDAGRIYFAGRDITSLPVHRRAALGLARSFQMTSIFPGFSALDNVALAVQSACRAQLSLLASGIYTGPGAPTGWRSATTCGIGRTRPGAGGAVITRRTAAARHRYGPGHRPATPAPR